MEWREYENGERDLEDFEPALSFRGRDVLSGDDHTLRIVQAPLFKAGLEAMGKEAVDLTRLHRAIDILANAGTLPSSYGPPATHAEGLGHCHVGPGRILAYKVDGGRLILLAVRSGAQSGPSEGRCRIQPCPKMSSSYRSRKSALSPE